MGMDDRIISTSPSILLVDDTAETLQVLTQLLREESYEVRPVLNGEQALLAAMNSPPDLILLDILMPDLDGYEVLRRLMADPKTREIPVIFLTAMNQEENEEKGLVLGAVDYIAKPYNEAIVKARVNTHIQLKLQRDQLVRQAEELRLAYNELESFSYSVSHDLKSPLQVIRTYSEFLATSLEKCGDMQAVEDAREIQTACEKMNQIINDLLQLSRASMESLFYEITDLSAMAECIITGLRRNDPDRRVEFLCEPGIKAMADSNLMQIAMQNLLHNAWKYTANTEKAVIELGVERQNGKLVICIHDNGIGFDMAKAGDLFKAFKRMHGSEDYEGTGIGLAIVFRIIQRHNGRIWAESRSGEGTTFRFTLG